MSKKLKNGIVTMFSLNGKTTIMGLQCQTDFLARSELFGNKAYEICRYVQNNNNDVAATIVKELSEESGEEIAIQSSVTVDFGIEDYTTNYYMHHDNRKVSIVILETKNWSKEVDQLAKDIAMNVVAFNPQFMKVDEINWDEVDLTFTDDQMKGKPDKVLEMMKEGKKKKYIKEHVLTEQPFVKDLKISVSQAINKVDSSIKIVNAYGIFV
jgi:elongation factor Ts